MAERAADGIAVKGQRRDELCRLGAQLEVEPAAAGDAPKDAADGAGAGADEAKPADEGGAAPADASAGEGGAAAAVEKPKAPAVPPAKV